MMQVKDYDLIEEIAELLPIPRGYKILVACPQVEEKTEGGIIIAENTRNKESVASILGYVIELGEDAYFDSDKSQQPLTVSRAIGSCSVPTPAHVSR
jgi:co-chaperonin GroES (HSP10)